MTSLNTNNSATIALATLRTINNALDTTNTRVSTGKKINNASDGAAYWSIATTLSSDNGALGAVKDAIALDKNSVDTTYKGLNTVISGLQTIKDKLTTAISSSVDRVTIQKEIAAQLDAVKSASDNTVANGNNWLTIKSDAAGFNADKSLLASFSRAGATVSVGTGKLDAGAFALYDTTADAAGSSANNADNQTTQTAIETAVTNGTALTLTKAVAADSKGLLDSVYTFGGTDVAGATAANLKTSIKGIDISKLTSSTADLNLIQGYVKLVDATIQQLNYAATDLGSTSTRLSSQSDFAKTLIDTNTSSIGSLVDADMEAESTKLKALQTQQQIGIQSLSIANSSTQNLLSLFR